MVVRSFRSLLKTFFVLFFTRIFLITPVIIVGAVLVVRLCALAPIEKDELQLAMKVLLEKVALTPAFVAEWWPLLLFDFCAGVVVYSWLLLSVLRVALQTHGVHTQEISWRMTMRAAVPIFVVDGVFRAGGFMWGGDIAMVILVPLTALCSVGYTLMFCFVLHERVSVTDASYETYDLLCAGGWVVWAQIALISLATLPFSIIPYGGWFLYLVALTQCVVHLYHGRDGSIC